ncbi:MAG: hypothetical protein ACLR2G_03435 [Phascolarctobacterium faecium]
MIAFIGDKLGSKIGKKNFLFLV